MIQNNQALRRDYPSAKPQAANADWRALIMILAFAPGIAHAQPVEAELHKPSAWPDRVVLTWRGDPARSQAVTWRTDVSVRDAVAEIAPADGGRAFLAKIASHKAVTTLLSTDLGEAHYHAVNFQDLVPGTQYAYRVGDGVRFSEWHHFRTASAKPEPFTFLYFGDAQHEIRSLWSRLVREAYAHAPRARFTLHAGDLINIAGSDSEWGEWHQAAGFINARIPVLPSPGNHEFSGFGAKEESGVTAHWKAQFALPANGPVGLEHCVYYLDIQGARIVCLNSNEKRAEQAAWLDRVLADNPNRWTIVTFHHPVMSSAFSRDNTDLRKRWLPILDKHRVDLVLQGHDHSYARSGLDGFRDAGGRGTVFVVSVSGPGFYKVDQLGWMRRWGEGKQLFQAITIDGDRLHYEARSATGELHDSFDLTKQPEGKMNVLEDGPAAPESKTSPQNPSSNWVPVLAVLGLVIVLVLMRVRRI
ncbi:MAG: metallophosphoesterase family protein [Gemmataceae bacterium]|nr:metallophosphoesterase family protein [Gemmataceae bacterium]